MRFALRRRLALLSLLATLACIGALLALFVGLRFAHGWRLEREREALTDTLERLREDATHQPRRGRAMRVGALDAQGNPVDESVPPQLLRVLQRAVPRAAASPGERVLDEESGPRAHLLVAVQRQPSGTYLWTSTRVLERPETAFLRNFMTVLGLTVLALAALAMHTALAVSRDAKALSQGLAHLKTKLRTALPEAQVEEFEHVARGITALAQSLADAHDKEAHLERELAQKERLASLGRVAAGLAHEVRNPLASIKLRADLAAGASNIPTEVRDDLNEIAGEVARLDRLVAALLTVAGRRIGARHEADLRALVRQRCALLEAEAAQSNVSLALEGDEGEVPALLDADAMARAVDNLLRNAVHFSPHPGTVRVRVTRKGTGTEVRVSDEGPGVPAERESELFEPFFSTRPEGTGLGLALSRALVEAHGGTLRYEREAGTTHFTIDLPVSESQPQ